MVAKILLSLFMLVGASSCILAVYFWFRNQRLAATGLYAPGHVLRSVEKAAHPNEWEFQRVMYAPVVMFTAFDGKTVEFTDSFPSGDPDHYKIGQEVVVLYDPRDFSHARIETGVTRNVGPVVLLIFGLFFLAIWYVVYVGEIRRG